MEEICEIACDLIRVSPFQPRRIFSDEELDELAASIKTVGLIHPPVVRKIENGGKTLYYELIAGERRWRATKRAGFEKITVIVRDANDENAAKATLIENIQRVNLDPLELAAGFKKLITVFRMTQEEVADRVGKKRSTVANYLRLLGLPDAIKGAISKGEITMGHAKAILALEGDELQKKLADLIVEKNLTVRDAEGESRKLVRKTGAKEGDSHLEEFREQLEYRYGTKIEILPARQGGKVVFHYSDSSDLERMFSLAPMEEV